MAYNGEYSWLNIAGNIAQTMAQFPHRLVEAAEIDRQIRDNSLKSEDVYNQFREMSLRIAEDDGLRARVAQKLGIDESQVSQEVLKRFRAPGKRENADRYISDMASNWSNIFSEITTGEDDVQLINALMLNGRTTEGMAKTANEARREMVERNAIKAANEAYNDSSITTRSQLEERVKATGQPVNMQHARYKELEMSDAISSVAEFTGNTDDLSRYSLSSLITKMKEEKENVSETELALLERYHKDALYQRKIMEDIALEKDRVSAERLKQQALLAKQSRDNEMSALEQKQKELQIQKLEAELDRGSFEDQLKIGNGLMTADLKSRLEILNNNKADKKGKVNKDIVKKITAYEKLIDHAEKNNNGIVFYEDAASIEGGNHPFIVFSEVSDIAKYKGNMKEVRSKLDRDPNVERILSDNGKEVTFIDKSGNVVKITDKPPYISRQEKPSEEPIGFDYNQQQQQSTYPGLMVQNRPSAKDLLMGKQ